MSQEPTTESPAPSPPPPTPTYLTPLLQSLRQTEFYQSPPSLNLSSHDPALEEGVEMLHLYVQLGQKQPLQKVIGTQINYRRARTQGYALVLYCEQPF